jgi:hypothetical protein
MHKEEGERSNVKRYNTGTDPYEDCPDVKDDDERDAREYGHGKTRAEVYLSNDTALCYHDDNACWGSLASDIGARLLQLG